MIIDHYIHCRIDMVLSYIQNFLVYYFQFQRFGISVEPSWRTNLYRVWNWCNKGGEKEDNTATALLKVSLGGTTKQGRSARRPT
jgi:hypothetical protein